MRALKLGIELAFLLCVLGVINHRAEAFSFSVEPSRVEISVPAGKTRGKTVRVKNLVEDSSTHLKVYFQDVIFKPDGSNDFPEPGSTAWSCAKWLQVVPQEVDLGPGKFEDVRLSVSVPEGSTGGHYAMVFFETSAPYYEQGLGVNFRIGAIVQVTVPDTEVYQAKLADIRIASPKDFQVDIFNDGNLLVRPKGKVKVFNEQSKRVAQWDFNTQTLGILPKSLRTFHITPAALSAGSYRLKVEIDYGSRYLLVGEKPFTVQ